MSLIYICVVLLCSTCICGQQLLVNPGFEQPLDGSDWECWGNCELVQDTDAHTGSYSGRVYDRTELWKSPMQFVSLAIESTYYFECWIKLLYVKEGFLYHNADLKLHLFYNDTESTHSTVSTQPHLTPERGWVKLAGDFYTGTTEFESAKVYIQVDEANVNYLVDTASLTKLIPNPDWKEEAEARIETIRKTDVTINLQISGEYNPENVTLEINQTRHHFAFGSATQAEQLVGTDQDSQKYRQCFFENFQWSVFENAHKWRQMEWKRDEIVYPDEAMEVLRNNSIPMRGHCLFWNNEERVPPWVLELSEQELVQEVRKRLNYTVPHYKGKLLHWDVNNEQLHGDFYEERTNDLDFMTKLFQETRAYDEDVALFLNDFSVVHVGSSARALANSAFLLLSQNASVGGLGLQSHLQNAITLDVITAIQKRLEIVGSVGLPIWITELDIIGIDNPTDLADAYDDVITLYYSDPTIEGVILWGFSDQHHWRPSAALFEGPDYTPNASGLRWQEMIRERWHTAVSFTASSPQESFGFRGFQGDYTLKVRHDGAVIKQQTFSVEKDDVSINVNV